MHFKNYQDTINSILNQVGKKIVMGIPLGLGKPIGIVNSLYQLACSDNTIDLTIITGLTLARPTITNELQKRLADPILERIIHDYEDPLYEKDRIKQQVPRNIRIIEFFLSPAKYLHNNYVQQNYISSAYTHVIRDALNLSINVIAQLITTSNDDPDTYSVSCNSDLFIDMVKALKMREQTNVKIAIVGEVNNKLPFMYGDDAEVNKEVFTHIVDTGNYKSLFALPRDEVAPQDHMIGLYTSSLIKDNGCLQIGIGSLSIALANALIIRHQSNSMYQDLLHQLGIKNKFGQTIANLYSLTPFERGLYASTELFTDEYLHLYKQGILKKYVYDHIGLQKLLNEGKIHDTIDADILDILLSHHLIKPKLTQECVNFLTEFGILKENVIYQDDYLIINSEKIPADLSVESSRQKIIQTCLGTELKNGVLLHAGFILGSTVLYSELNAMSNDERKLFNMSAISKTNQLSWKPELLALQRIHGRFVNSAMMVTMTGAIISDGLANIQEISGVGGQFDFVNMAQNLHDARSIITCRSTRQTDHGLESNIRWNYPNNTIPRFLRDIVITEYGIADCRSKTDSDVIKAMLNITDSRFQKALLKKAKQFGKLESDYEIPVQYQQNHKEGVESIIKSLQLKGYCQPYPFGTELTDDELIIKKALTPLKYYNKYQLFLFIIKSICYIKSDTPFEKYLYRMNLAKPKNTSEWIYKKILKYAISRISRNKPIE